MSLKLIRFGTWAAGMTTLPVLERSHEMGSGASRLVLLDSPDGQVDGLGTEKARRTAFNLTHNCRLYGVTAASMLSQLDALRAMRGDRDKLWMVTHAGDLRWLYARLDSISGQNIPRNSLYLPVAINFSVLPQIWNGAYHDNWTFDSGYYFDEGMYFDSDLVFALDSTPKTVTVGNDGNVDVENCIITVTAQTSSITALVIKRKVGGTTYEHLEYAGTIAATKSLVIDCGAQSVKNDGTGDSANFSRGADHKYDGWLKLLPGDNSIEVTRTGGGTTSSVEFNFWDGWA